jgi:hypothetical protein
MVKCLAPNGFTKISFNAEDYTCTVYKNANDLSDYEKELTIRANNNDRNAIALLRLKIKEFNKEFKGLTFRENEILLRMSFFKNIDRGDEIGNTGNSSNW